MEALMDPSSDLLSTPELDYEGWKDALRPDWGGTTQGDVGIGQNAANFTGLNLPYNARA